MTLEQYDKGAYKRYDQERQTEEFFADLIKDGKATANMRFGDLREAEDYSIKYADRVIADMNTLPSVGRMVLKLDGAGVLIPNINIEETSGAITVHYDEETPLITKPPLADRFGIARSVSAPVLIHDHGQYSIMPIVIFKDASSTQTEITSNGRDLMHIETNSFTYVHCDGSAEITVPALDRFRATSASLGLLATYCSPEVASSAQTIANAFYSEDPHSYTPFRRVDLLATIASKTIEESSNAPVVADSMLDVLGRSRTVVIEGDMYHKLSDVPAVREVKGSILDVLPFDPQSRTDQPTIVLEVGDDNAKTVYYAPFSSINTLSF